MHQQQNGERDQHGRVDDHRSPHEAKDKQQHESRTHGCCHALWATRRPPKCKNNPINTGTTVRGSECVRERGSAASHCCDIIHSGEHRTHTHTRAALQQLSFLVCCSRTALLPNEQLLCTDSVCVFRFPSHSWLAVGIDAYMQIRENNKHSSSSPESTKAQSTC